MVSFIKNILIVGVRTFINPGWYEEIWMKCTNCSSASQAALVRLSSGVDVPYKTISLAFFSLIQPFKTLKNEESELNVGDEVIKVRGKSLRCL